MSDWVFAAPHWVHLLWAVAAYVAVLWWLERRQGNALERFASSALRARLVSSPSQAQRSTRIILLGLTGAFLTLALMRPQWGLELVATPRAGAEIMICLDVSNSMLAEDVAPNRLERAKAEIRDLLAYLDGDQVGLIAFAGRATVLSPLTPDFGFLRLALDNASPRSVSRGGTRLEEPIRKAVAGFASTGDVSRSILLITDGEDHDSFPLEAAKAAAERGIRILSIGFGDEAGSEIRITDPRTKATTVLRDANAKPVKSRLDGELLREMALTTNGAYIPAGTGVLDLQSIFEQHIAPLTRGRLDGRTRTIRNDIYQWAVLLGLICLLGSVVATSRPYRDPSSPSPKALPPGVVRSIVLIVALGSSTLGPLGPRSAQADDQAGATAETGPPASESGDVSAQRPRAIYNLGLAHFSGTKLDAARESFELARRKADTDGEVRLRATYSLGWIAVKQADALLESAPADALASLERGAVWFREAVALRPGWEDARYNLELVERRVTELADAIAAEDELDLGEKLDALIESQRALLEDLGAEVTRARAATDPNATVEARRTYRGLSARQLAVLADADTVNTQAVRELEAIKGKAERTPEDGLRATQLGGVTHYVHLAREKLTQTRSRLRRLHVDGAYRRGAGGLDAIKRARDQLLAPVQRIDALLSDARYLMALTRPLALLQTGPQTGRDTGSGTGSGTGSDTGPEAVPGWLTTAYLSEAQQRLTERELELSDGIERALDQPAPDPAGSGQPAVLLAQLRQAAPLLKAATDASRRASAYLDDETPKLAFSEQTSSYESLLRARELFLDIRRLIDLIYQEEKTLLGVIGPATDTATPAPTPGIDQLSAKQDQNVDRMARLGTLISDELANLATAADPSAPARSAATPSAANQEQQRLESAYEHWRLANRAMHEVRQFLARPEAHDGAPETPAPVVEAVVDAVQTTVAHLENLRRLFFNLLEHLKETAAQQERLGDETESLIALGGGAPPAKKTGPIAVQQKQLAEAAGAIAQALQEQAATPPPANPLPPNAAGPAAAIPAPPGNPPNSGGGPGSAASTTPQSSGPTQAQREQFKQASHQVDQARERMDQAAVSIESGGADFPKSRDHQSSAVKYLAEAIALLEPPPQPGESDGQDGADQKDEAGKGDEATPEPDQSLADRSSMRELLQEVRDREAQRRRDQAQQPRKYDPVEKDW